MHPHYKYTLRISLHYHGYTENYPEKVKFTTDSLKNIIIPFFEKYSISAENRLNSTNLNGLTMSERPKSELERGYSRGLAVSRRS